jgi:hypothetical protein
VPEEARVIVDATTYGDLPNGHTLVVGGTLAPPLLTT